MSQRMPRVFSVAVSLIDDSDVDTLCSRVMWDWTRGLIAALLLLIECADGD